MDDLWTLVRFAHLLAVAAWLGGMLFLGLVVIPSVRAHGGVRASRALVTTVGRRFGMLGGLAWTVILVSGGGLMHQRGLRFGDLTDTEYGRRVLIKLVLLLAIGVAVVFHSVVQGPRIRRAEEAGDEAARAQWRKVGAVLDAAMLLATLAALWLGASLAA